MKRLFVCTILVLSVLLGGCTPETPNFTPTASVQPYTVTAMSLPRLPTLTSQPTRTPTLTPTPTLTSTPAPTLIPLPQVVISSTPTQGVSAITIENAQQVVQLARLGKGTAYDTSWSPDGRYFLVETSLGLYLYEPEKWEMVRFLEASRAYGWSPDGGYLAIESSYDATPEGINLFDGEKLEPVKFISTGNRFRWSEDGRWLAVVGPSDIFLYDAHTLRLVQSLNTHAFVRSLKFSPDGKTFAILDDQVHLWDIATGDLIRTLEGNFKDADSFYAFVYNAIGETLLCLASGGEGSDIFFYIWDVTTGKIIYSQLGFAESRYAFDAVFSPDGSQAALVVYSQIIMLDSRSGEILRTISATDIDKFINGPVEIIYSPDGKKLITTAGVFDVEDGKRLSDRGYSQFRMSPDGGVLASGGWNEKDGNFVQLWNIEQNKLEFTWPGEYDWAMDVSFSPGGEFIASFNRNNVELHNVATGEELQQIVFDSDSVGNIIFSPTMKQASNYELAVGDGKLWKISTDQVVQSSWGDGGSIAISPDGRFWASIDGDDKIHVKDIFTDQILRTLTTDISARLSLHNLSYSSDGQILAAGSYETYSGSPECNNCLYFWDVNTGQLLRRIEGKTCGSAFGPNKGQFAWAYGNIVQIVNVLTGDPVINFKKENPEPEEGYSSSIAFSSDGRLLAAGTSVGSIDIWSVDTGELIHTLQGHEMVHVGYDEIPMEDISSMDFSPYGYLLASVGMDCTMRLWEANTGRLLRVFESLCGPVVFSPDGALLASGATDGTVVILIISQE